MNSYWHIIRFVLYFIIIYGLMNAVFYKTSLNVFHITGFLKKSFLFIIFLFGTGPVLTRFFEKKSMFTTAVLIGKPSYIWMAFLFEFCFFIFIFYVYNLIFGKFFFITGNYRYILSVILSLSICIYGYFESHNIRINNIEIRTDKIKNDKFLYVSNGTGYWGPPVRFLSNPEITVFTIKKKIE